jgi:hypothetical protein
MADVSGTAAVDTIRPMAADTSHLAPQDAKVALRSYPRRFRGAFSTAVASSKDAASETDPDELGRRLGPDGRAAIDHLVVADGLLAHLTSALEAIHDGREAIAHGAIVDANQRTWSDDHSPLAHLLDQFERTAISSADAVGALGSDDWGVTVSIAGSSMTEPAITTMRRVVADISGLLDQVNSTLRAVRGR